MRNFLILLFALVVTMPAVSQMNSQSSYLSDFSGSIIKASKANDDAFGTVYLNDVWCSGQVSNMQGKSLEMTRMRFNILLNRVEYEMNGNTYELTIPYKDFSISLPSDNGSFRTATFKNNFPATEQQTAKSFYEVVYDGKTKLLRHHKIRISEHAEPLSLVRVKRFNKSSALYVYHPIKNTVVRIGKNRSELLTIFDDKKESVQRFLSDTRIKKKINETDVARVCQFVDSQL